MDEDDVLPQHTSRANVTSASTSLSLSSAERLFGGETPIDRCSIALDILAEVDHDGWFAEPVTDDIAPGYSEYVDEPIDFSTIQDKLKTGSYGDQIDGFVEDVRLLYRNAVT